MYFNIIIPVIINFIMFCSYFLITFHYHFLFLTGKFIKIDYLKYF
jgi:hypothetical protein